MVLSVPTRIDEQFQGSMNTKKVDLIAVTEKWLRKDDTDNCIPR